jgi:hypothetical protein
MVDGQPPRTGAIRDIKSGASGAKVLAVYVMRKGQPLATSAKERNQVEVCA